MHPSGAASVGAPKIQCPLPPQGRQGGRMARARGSSRERQRQLAWFHARPLANIERVARGSSRERQSSDFLINFFENIFFALREKTFSACLYGWLAEKVHDHCLLTAACLLRRPGPLELASRRSRPGARSIESSHSRCLQRRNAQTTLMESQFDNHAAPCDD